MTTNNREGAYNLTKYLVKKGHKRIAITLSTLFSTERERLEGYKKALRDFDIKIDPSLIQAVNEPFIENRFYHYARALLSLNKNITAVFAGHDRIAYIIYSVAKELGIRIPDDISLVGYDDLNIPNLQSIELTTMHQPIYEMGVESMKLIMARIRGEIDKSQHIVLKSSLVERNSVKAVG